MTIAPPNLPTETRGARLRFAAALTAYGLWIIALAAMAIGTARPPVPETGVNPGADPAVVPDRDVPAPRDEER